MDRDPKTAITRFRSKQAWVGILLGALIFATCASFCDWLEEMAWQRKMENLLVMVRHHERSPAAQRQE
jgi:hypothetical protein